MSCKGQVHESQFKPPDPLISCSLEPPNLDRDIFIISYYPDM